MHHHTTTLEALAPLLLVCGLAILSALVGYVILVATSARRETLQANKTDFFTCDKHGAFPMKWTVEVPMPDGGADYKMCLFCFEEGFKKADAALRAQEARRQPTTTK